MASNRLAVLQSMVDQNPADAFARYGLAMEYANSGNLEDAAGQFEELLRHNETYAAAYSHAGQVFEKMGRADEARRMYEKGIEVTTSSGDMKTRNELQAALDMLPL